MMYIWSVSKTKFTGGRIVARINVNISEETFTALFLGDRDNAVSSLLGEVLSQLLHKRASDLCGAERHEHTPERVDYRNGSRERTVRLSIGRSTIQVPRLRKQSLIEDFSGVPHFLSAMFSDCSFRTVSRLWHCLSYHVFHRLFPIFT